MEPSPAPAADPKPVYTRCEFCHQPMRPGESHGQVKAALNPEEDASIACMIWSDVVDPTGQRAKVAVHLEQPAR